MPLILRTTTSVQLISISIYVVCALAMFGISSIYHRLNWSPEKRILWRKLDHGGIYLMIAGTFTPVAVLALSSESARNLLIAVWAVAIVGVIQSIWFINLPKAVSAIIYIVAGYLCLPYIAELKISLGSNLLLLFLGGISYTVGAICYGLKRPALNPKIFGYHEVFHLFVNLGAVLHFFVISSLVK